MNSVFFFKYDKAYTTSAKIVKRSVFVYKMPSCIVPGCKNRSREVLQEKPQNEIEKEMGKNITFHRLPLNQTRRKQWLDNLGICLPQQKYPMVCCVHFKETAFDKTSLSYVKLKETAIPYITIPEDEVVSPYKAKSNTKRSQKSVVQVTIPQEETVPSKRTKVDNEMSVEGIDKFIPTIIQESDNTVYEELHLVEGKQFVSRSTLTSPERFCNLCKEHQMRSTSSLHILPDPTADIVRKRHLRRTFRNMKNSYERKIKILAQKYHRSQKRVASLKDFLKNVARQRYLIVY